MNLLKKLIRMFSFNNNNKLMKSFICHVKQQMKFIHIRETVNFLMIIEINYKKKFKII